MQNPQSVGSENIKKNHIPGSNAVTESSMVSDSFATAILRQN